MFGAIIGMMCISLIIGITASILIFVPLCIYVIPYAWWAGGYEVRKVYGNKIKTTSFFKDIHNATILYKHWLFNKELTF